MNLLDQIEAEQRKKVPTLKAGQTVRVHAKVIEGEKERTQVFEGVVIGISGSGNRRTFTVRKISSGVGVERTFPIHSTKIESIKVVRRGRVRRAKLFYLRDRIGKATRIKARQRKLKEEYALQGAGDLKPKARQGRKKKRKRK